MDNLYYVLSKKATDVHSYIGRKASYVVCSSLYPGYWVILAYKCVFY